MTALLTFISGASMAAPYGSVCTDSKDTAEDTNCLTGEMKLKEAKLQKYLSAAQKQEKYFKRNDKELIETQQIWKKYMTRHCAYMYSREPGSARYRDSAECQLRLYDERIREIWLAYLTYNGSTSPVLPDPKD